MGFPRDYLYLSTSLLAQENSKTASTILIVSIRDSKVAESFEF
jgi:hypothetical protein